ncbi:MAG TPA: GGDEF domain-containing response regulator [Burkholderiales bacterium]|nr:GGDEF domain-containing response regulator [Burkholderiales bacterium]
MARNEPLRVILVEDSEDDAFLLKRQLQDAGYDVDLERVDNKPALLTALANGPWDIAFSDFSMPNFDGMQALKVIREQDKELPFIIVSGTIGEERAVQLMKLGAQDYVIKGNVKRLVPAIERELQDAVLRREHRQAQEHIRRLAYYNSLTQLANRHRLTEDIHDMAEAGKHFALLLVNMNNFREVNGALGHAKGDELICEVALRLQELGAQQVGLYHLHGSEFALLTEKCDKADVDSLAKSVLHVLSRHFHSAGFRIHMGARIGIALYADGDVDVHNLLQRADMAVTFAKREHASYAWYDPDRDPSKPDRLALLADLHDAINTDQLRLVFQPKVQCSSGAITGCEALIRWHHPTRGLIGPDTFINMAERAGLIDDLTRHVVRNAAVQIKAWHTRGVVLPVALNLSVNNLQNTDLIDEIVNLATQGHESPCIELEITETALMHDPQKAMTVLQRVYDAGIRIYIDDFGTGFSSLGYLKKLPIHGIKIDKSFVMDLEHNPDSEAIVISTIGLAHNLGLTIVAEGVENQEIWKRLIANQCDEAQGYYFAQPLPPERFETMVSKPDDST